MKPNWQTKKLKDVAVIVTGTTPKKENLSFYGGRLPFVKPSQLQNKYITETSEYLTEEGWQVARWLPKDASLVTCIGDLGRVGLTKYSVAFNQQINGVMFDHDIDFKFGFYYLQSPVARKYYNQKASATTVSILNKSKFGELEVCFPEKNEQELIAQTLDTLFSKIDAGEESLRQVEKQLEVYRQAVLRKAFGGVRDEIKLSEVAVINPKKEILDDDLSVSFIPMSAVAGVINVIDKKESRKVRDVKKGYTQFKNGDVIMAKITPCMENGKFAVVRGLESQWAYGSTEFHVIRADTSQVMPEYIFLFLIQDGYRLEAKRSMTGTAGHMRVSKDYVESTMIPLPKIDQQREIIEMVSNKLSLIEHTRTLLSKAKLETKNLRQSILKKAFSGELL